MLVACSTLCFTSVSLTEAVKRMREMQFTHIDLSIHEAGPHLKPSELLADPARTAARLRAEGLPYAAFHFVPNEPHGDDARNQCRAVTRLARNLSVATVTTTVGMDWDAETKRLQDWVQIAERDGIILAVETNAAGLTIDPNAAVELCRRVPGLGLTLDPSHYTCGLESEANYECVYRYVRHVRLRDTGPRPEEFQVRIGQGTLEYAKLLHGLEKFRYDRTLTVDVRDISDSAFAIEPEVRKLKYLVESLI